MLDPTFGNGGRVVTDFSAGSAAAGAGNSAVVQADGKVIVAGRLTEPGSNYSSFAIARYNLNGSLDASFGNNGLVTVNFGSRTDSHATSVAVQADGKIVVAGEAAPEDPDSPGSFAGYFGVARLNSDGSLDPYFGTAGKKTVNFSSMFSGAQGVVVQSDGKIVLAGYAQSLTDYTSFQYAMARLNSDGGLDSSFGAGGQITFGSGIGENLALQADGKLVVVGEVGDFSTTGLGIDVEVSRLNSDGSLDVTFGIGGQMSINFGYSTNFGFNLAVQSDAQIVVAGFASAYPDFPNGPDYAVAVARLNNDGILDSTFDDDGKSITSVSFPGTGIAFADTGMAVQPDGKIVVATTSFLPGGGDEFFVARLNGDGSPDNTFGNNGTVTTDFGGGTDEGYVVALQADGKIIAGGFSRTSRQGFALARYYGGAMDVTTQSAVASQITRLITTSNLSGQPGQVTFQAHVQADVDTMLAAVNALSAATTDVTVTIDLGGGTYSTNGVALDPPDNVIVVIQNGTLDPDMPSLTVAGGAVTVLNCTLLTTGDAPTILVSGGLLTLRNDIVQESSGFNRTAIEIRGGTVDLGTTSAPGGNTINLNGAGAWIQNTGPNPVSIFGNTFLNNGAALSAPLVGSVLTPFDPVRTAVPVTASANFTGMSSSATHTALWSWGDGAASPGSVNENYGSVTGSHVYSTPGVYTVTLTVTNNAGASGQSIFQYVVIFDPSAGFVTGGGWINSPAGAYPASPSLAGKANFGFESRYHNGNNVPTGNTEFQFKLANFNFKSTVYEWLVVSGAKARFRGVGTVNGAGSFGFELTAWDGQAPGGGGTDRFRIKIWNANQGNGVVYDNMMGAADGADPTTTLGGGSIVIHRLDSLMAAGGPRPPTVAAPTPRLSAGALQPILAAAIDRWAVAGLDFTRLNVMRNATITIADLGGSYLGLANAVTHVIRIDDDAAGFGWFVDSTPREDSEFRRPGDRRVRGRMDLLSVIAHELGHLVGLDDNHDAGHAADVMGDSLAAGRRRMPTVDVVPTTAEHLTDSFRRRPARR